MPCKNPAMSFRDQINRSASSISGLLKVTRWNVVELDIANFLESRESPPGIEWRFAESNDFDEDIPELRLNAGRRRHAKQMLEEGSACLLAEYEGRPVHIRWMTFGRLHTDPFDLPLGPGWVYLHRIRTATAFRGRGLQQAGAKVTMEHAQRRGARRVVGIVETGNSVSMHVTKKVGYQRTGSMTSVRLLNRFYLKRTPREVSERLAAPA